MDSMDTWMDSMDMWIHSMDIWMDNINAYSRCIIWIEFCVEPETRIRSKV